MCRAEQSKGNQTAGSPALSASPGDMIALRYQENGHVSIPGAGKPANRGTVSIYGTTQPRADEKFLNIHNVWTADGTGGDKRGFLLATRNYDDGQCYQVNGDAISQARQKAFPHEPTNKMGGDIWCQSDIVIPANVTAEGLFTIYWVWDWPTATTPEVPAGKPETYTSCMDIILVPGEGTSKNGVNFIKGQDLNEAAVEIQLTEQFLVPVGGAIAIQGSAAVQATSSTTVATAAPDAGVDVVTVTVTAPAITTMKTVTVTASPPDSAPTSSSSAPDSASTSSTGTLDVRPFLTSSLAATATAKGTKIVTTVVQETVVVTLTSTARMGAFTVMPRIRGRARL